MNDSDEILQRLRAIEIALTYGLGKKATPRKALQCSLTWAHAYVRVPEVAMLTRDQVIAKTADVLREYADGSEPIAQCPTWTPAVCILERATNRWDVTYTANIVRALEHHGITWADYGWKPELEENMTWDEVMEMAGPALRAHIAVCMEFEDVPVESPADYVQRKAEGRWAPSKIARLVRALDGKYTWSDFGWMPRKEMQ